MFQKKNCSEKSKKHLVLAFAFCFFLLSLCIAIDVYFPSKPSKTISNSSILASSKSAGFSSNFTEKANYIESYNPDDLQIKSENIPTVVKNNKLAFAYLVSSQNQQPSKPQSNLQKQAELNKESAATSSEEIPDIIEETDKVEPIIPSFPEAELMPVSFANTVIDYSTQEDKGLSYYRNDKTKAAVEWFYTNITENQDITLAILEFANKNNIPLSLAFALAWTESRYNPVAVNKNTNSSIDRGLFQLNNNSFPKLTENDFFDPRISAKYGMSHLRFCLDTAGNEIAALAMYNAGTNKVRNNSTPQCTLNYVSKIITYQQGIEELFSIEVIDFYQHNAVSYLAMAKSGF